MTVTQLTRRAVLSASAATVAIVAPAAVLVATPANDGGLLALEARWRAALADQKRVHHEWARIHDSLPEHAQGGWPRIPENHPAFDLWQSAILGKPGEAIPLEHLKKFNDKVERFAITTEVPAAELAEVRRKCAARIEWWNATHDDGERLRKASGLDAAHDGSEAA
jgi:hypothetical protein